MGKCKKIFRVLSLSLLCLAIPLFGAIGYYGRSLPDIYHLPKVEEFSIASRPYLTVSTSSAPADPAPVSISAGETGFLDLKLFGIVPIKEVTVRQTPRASLSPSGIPFGIKMFTDGVLVVGMSNVETDSGFANPAKDAGLQIGDVLCRLGDEKVSRNEDISRIVERSGGQPMVCVFRRDGREMSTTITPVKGPAGPVWRIGIWVRDSTAGIGTMTYLDPAENTFAGLGHGVCDVDTGKLMPLMSGEIVSVSINDVVKGQSGNPGELRGVFHENNTLGKLTSNRQTGVYGRMDAPVAAGNTLPVAFRQEVCAGAAQILTTVQGSNPRLYDIKIEKISFSQNTPTKNMIIRITDPNLLDKTGGIIQGMSGSPIIQNGKLVGAVTHVFINDPSKGYGIFAENMLEAAG